MIKKLKANYSFTLKKPAKADENQKYPIYLLITLNREVARIAAKKEIALSEWDTKLKLPRKDEKLKSFLTELKESVQLEELLLLKENKTYSAADIKKVFSGVKEVNTKFYTYFTDFIEAQVSRNEVGAKRILRYKFVRDAFVRFLTKTTGKQDVALKDVTNKMLTDFETFLLSVPRIKDGPVLSRNTTNGYMKIIKMIFLKATNDGEISKNPAISIKLKSTPTSPVFLTKDELVRIYEKELPDNSHSCWARDIFIFCCLTSPRIVDTMSLTTDDISRDNNGLYLNLKQNKTKEVVQIPLSRISLEIIDKYKNHDSRILKKRLLPQLSTSTIRTMLTEIVAMTGITKKVKIHTSRHTFAVRFLENGGSMETLQALMGHNSIRTTAIYAKITKSRINQEHHAIQNIL